MSQTKDNNSQVVEYPRTGTWRRCQSCGFRIDIIKEVFWRLQQNGNTTYYHDSCKPAIDLVRFDK